MRTLNFVNIVNFMNDKIEPKTTDKLTMHSQFSERGLYVREDDQDWGSAGMNDVQKDTEKNK